MLALPSNLVYMLRRYRTFLAIVLVSYRRCWAAEACISLNHRVESRMPAQDMMYAGAARESAQRW